MNLISKIATAGAVAAMGLGLGAAGASANVELSPNPQPFLGEQDPNNPNSFSAGSAVVECDVAEFAGNTANSDTTYIPFHAEYDDCSFDFGIFGTLPATVTTHSDWRLHYTSGNASSGVTADVDILAPAGGGNAVTISVSGVCTISIPAQSGLSHVVATNTTPTGVNIEATVDDINYTASGLCPGVGDGTDGSYNGGVIIPGITITDVP